MSILDLSHLKLGTTGHAAITVGPEHCASRVGSGTLDVLATPMMIALMEAAAVDCVERQLGDGLTSLGTRIAISHDAPSAVGSRVTAAAELVSVQDRNLTFRVEARDEVSVIGSGTHRRVVVETARFQAKLAQRRGPQS